MIKVRLDKDLWYVYEISKYGDRTVRITRNFLSHYTKVMREFEALQERLEKLLDETPEPPEGWRYNLPDADPMKLYRESNEQDKG